MRLEVWKTKVITISSIDPGEDFMKSIMPQETHHVKSTDRTLYNAQAVTTCQHVGQARCAFSSGNSALTLE
jgi:hypothetical protein